jgi:uncharacterized SAM-binding protein YcdF (DUF218 family)
MTTRSAESSRAASGRHGFRACFLAALALLALAYLLLRGAGAFLIVSDPLKQADAVVPLGGGSAERVTEAVQIIQQYPRALLILTEPGEVKPGEGSGSTFYRQVAVESGLSPHSILITEGIQSSTRDEAAAVLRLMQAHGMKTVIVVTEPYHTRRARMIFRDAFKGSGLVVRLHPVSNHWYRPDTWFLSAEGWRMTLNEYIRLAGY